jgi:hypothetical protein
MKKVGPCCIVVSVSLLAVSLPAISDSLSPDLILVDGKVFTSAPSKPYVQAITIRGDKVVAVGDSSMIEASAGPSTIKLAKSLRPSFLPWQQPRIFHPSVLGVCENLFPEAAF